NNLQPWKVMHRVMGLVIIRSKWNVFNDLLKRKNSVIQDQSAGLQMKIVAEDKVVQTEIEGLLADWEKEKPISGELKPDSAMNTINHFQTQVQRLQDKYKLVCWAKEALDLERTSNNHLDPVGEEISNLKAVRSAISGMWAQLAKLCKKTWSSVTSRKLCQSLEAVLTNWRAILALSGVSVLLGGGGGAKECADGFSVTASHLALVNSSATTSALPAGKRKTVPSSSTKAAMGSSTQEESVPGLPSHGGATTAAAAAEITSLAELSKLLVAQIVAIMMMVEEERGRGWAGMMPAQMAE
ncbi:hypothetical protein PCASD_01469, partial [Puccinia coronata f. sp. avenae]